MSITVEQRSGRDRRRITRSGRRRDDPCAPNQQAAYLASSTSGAAPISELASQPFRESRTLEFPREVLSVDDEHRGDTE